MQNYIDDTVFIHSDRFVDSQIKEYLHTICISIVNYYKGVNSIILYGSFARGDACFSHIKYGEPIYASDIDILVCTPYSYTKLLGGNMPTELQKISQKIKIDLHFTKKMPVIQKSPLKDHFDIQTTAKNLWGRKLISSKSILANPVPPSEGLRLIFNRMFTLFPFLYEIHDRDKDVQKVLSIKKSAKVIQDCCQSILIFSKRYDGQCNSTFQKTLQFIDHDHPMLLKKLPSFRIQLSWAQNVLYGENTQEITAKKALAWAHEILIVCAKYFMGKYYSIKQKDIHELVLSFLSTHSNIYISSMLHYNIRLLIIQKIIYPAALRTFFIPACYYWYSALLYMFEGYEKNDTQQKQYYDSALALLRCIYPVANTSVTFEGKINIRYDYLYEVLCKTAQVSLQVVSPTMKCFKRGNPFF